MNFSKISAVVLVAVAPVVAHAQLNQLLGVIHSVQNTVTQPATGQPQQSGQDTVQQQEQQQEQSDNAAYRAQMEQRASAGRQQAQQMVADQDAKDIAKYKASQHSDQQQAQQQFNDAKKSAAACRTLLDQKLPIAERFIRCRNQGLTESQEMMFVGAMPLTAQPYIASMVQDVFEDNVIDPARGKAITDYYDACYRRGTPCVRPKW
ncbi:hypothetical protein [Paraburkholderia silvatlantica]|uniref:Ca2+-dependent lipid-binding protein n=1 Tax=Paraburkholderia silvatlantica TaxID=321895 RepID=A0ABR6FZE6_9BURK|nr:hypothetical protein [Paraburkholderia silvatlantica]MBB2932794.1 Ca2+-dependent lipid-binding protein [Paraburkholderia silvatlantica]PVY20764.1 hypothetical protein C7411_13939 [Paraburkholderia silvatlantica]PXW25204.1 hypothetical protein C7413_14139 [Paraburkholderia silvatlantica]